MSVDTWCADANRTHPHIVREVHAGYFAAGAEVITANTYASSPFTLLHANRLNELEELDQLALDHAFSAIGNKACIAGSMSTMRPMQKGSDRNNLALNWSAEERRVLFKRKAEALKSAGAQLIMMEMMRDTDYAPYACEAALATGLPVWIGVSAEPDKSGGLQGWGRDDCKFEDVVRPLAAMQPDVMCIMHTAPNDVANALNILKLHWSGPTGVYPESGYFKSPDWSFDDSITPTALLEFAQHWHKMGVKIFGGCCGTGPEHVRILAQEFQS